MRWNGCKVIIASTVTALLVMCGISGATVYASKKDTVNCSLNKMKYTNDGGVTTLDINKQKELEVTMNTESLEEGYYTSFLYLDKEAYVKAGQVVSMAIKTKGPLAMNLNLIDQQGKAYVCEEQSQVFLKEKGAKVYQIEVVKNGVFTVPEGFDGKVYIPVDTAAGKKQLAKVTTLAFIFVQKEEIENSVTISKLNLLLKNHAVSKIAAKSYQVQGKDIVDVPSRGDYAYQYNMCLNGAPVEDIVVSVKEEAEGVSVTEDGLLTVSEDASVSAIHLVFTCSDFSQFSYTVTLNPSNQNIPRETEAVQYKDSLDHEKKAAFKDMCIRMVLVLGMIGYLIFYRKKIRQK